MSTAYSAGVSVDIPANDEDRVLHTMRSLRGFSFRVCSTLTLCPVAHFLRSVIQEPFPCSIRYRHEVAGDVPKCVADCRFSVKYCKSGGEFFPREQCMAVELAGSPPQCFTANFADKFGNVFRKYDLTR